METSVFLLMQSISEEQCNIKFSKGLNYCLHAEKLGFHSIWLGEHHFSRYSPLSRPLIFAAFLAARTTGIRIGIAAILVTIQHPLILAEEIAMLDQLSNGRLEIGFGRGEEEYVFDRLGLSMSSAREHWDEKVEIVYQSLINESLKYKGNLHDIPNTFINPRPYQLPSPPIWVVASHGQSLRNALSKNYGLLTRGIFGESKLAVNFHKELEVAMSDLDIVNFPRIAVQVIIYVALSPEDAVDAAFHAKNSIRHTQDLRCQKAMNRNEISHSAINEVFDSHAIIGTPDQVIAKIRTIHVKIKIAHLIANFAFGEIGERRVFESMERFAQYVVPALKKI